MTSRRILLALLLSVSIITFSQESTSPKKSFTPEGKAIIRVFANYNSNLGGTETVDAKESMNIKRAYLGYKSTLSEEFSMKVTMDVGNSSGKYSAYLKTAELKYKKNKFSANIGMIATKQFKVQEGFWGYRYLHKSFQDQYKYNSSADLGLSVAYKINKLISVDAILQNGEGYKHIDPTGTYRGGLGATIKYKPITFRLYYDISAKPEVNRENLAAFIGYQFKKKFRIAAEYNYQMNNKFAKDHNMFGYSAYATYIINKKFELFVRYDNSESNVIEEHNPTIPAEAWNIKKDESLALIGFQYSALKNVKISANYRRTLSAVKDSEGVNWIFLNLEFKL